MSPVRAPGVFAASCEAFLPSLCLHCGEPLGGRDVALCSSCWASVIPLVGARCSRCGGSADEFAEQGCLACSMASIPQQGTVIWGEYDGALRSAVLGLKHRGRDELAQPLGQRLAGRVALETWASDIDLVVHVPSHPLRRLRNGRSAAAELAAVVAGVLDRPRERALTRRGLRRQTGRSRPQRIQLPRRSFRCITRVAGKSLLVVDDVTTTGTTLRRAAEVLADAGAEVVYCAALAGTPDPRMTT